MLHSIFEWSHLDNQLYKPSQPDDLQHCGIEMVYHQSKATLHPLEPEYDVYQLDDLKGKRILFHANMHNDFLLI